MGMRTLFFYLSVVLLCSSSVTSGQSSSEKQAAGRAWDSLIRTKGGRDKLYGIKSALLEYHPDRPEEDRFSQLWLFPDYYWETGYIDLPRKGYAAVNDIAKHIRKSAGFFSNNIESLDTWANPDHFERILPFLLETRWFKPEPIRVRRFRKGKKTLELIETTFRDHRLDFTYEIEDQLVTEVDEYWGDNAPDVLKGRLDQKWAFDDYVDVDGIKLARRWRMIWFPDLYHAFADQEFRLSLNVDYDPDLFTRTLPAIGSNGWRKAVK